MKRKAGFTLIELLAVIVVLAVIALVATPLIMGVIEDAKRGAAESSGKGYLDAVEKQVAINLLDGNETTNIEDKRYTVEELLGKNVTVKGEKPSNDSWVEISGGNVSACELKFTEYTYNCNGEIVKNDAAGGEQEENLEGKTGKLSDDDWATIARRIKIKPDYYEIGDTKSITLNNGLSTEVVLVNTTPCDGSLESETACGPVFMFKYAYESKPMYNNCVDHAYYGWGGSTLRTYLNSEYINKFPDELKNVIINTHVVSGHNYGMYTCTDSSGNTYEASYEGDVYEKQDDYCNQIDTHCDNWEFVESTSNIVSNDKLYLASAKEIFGTLYVSDYDNRDTAAESTRQLDYYKNLGVTESNKSGAIKLYGSENGIGVDWWLRSAYDYFGTGNLGAMTYIYDDGYLSYSDVSNEKYLVPVFRIG